jgi:hypothetical protein
MVSSEEEYPVPRPRDDTGAVQDIARDLGQVAHRIARFKGEANAYLSEDPKYGPLGLRLEAAHAAVEAAMVEARRRVRLNESR